MMTDIAIFGAGGFGKEVKMLIDQINEEKKEYNFIGYFDDGLEKGESIHGYKVLGGMDDLNRYKGELGLVISVAEPKTKRKILKNIIKKEITFPVLIHPSCHLGEDHVEIGEGTIICAGTILTVDIQIGRHVILNLSCTVGHDTTVGDYSSIMPSVNISGETVLSEGVYCGTGAKLVNRLNIGSWTIIGAGSVVAKDLPANCTAVGVPAKPIKFHD